MTLTVSSKEYKGDYIVSCTVTGEECQVVYNGSVLLPDGCITLRNGAHTFTSTSCSSGRSTFVFTVTDSYG